MTAEIAALVEAYRSGWAHRDVATIASIWGSEYEVVYCPSELDRPIVGAASIGRYYDRVFHDIGAVHVMTADDVRIDIIGDMAYAFFSFHLEGETGRDARVVRCRRPQHADRAANR